jgi:hypothetical protein
MLVFVISKEGNPLMPCKPATARKLLRNGYAKRAKRKVFTIQLNFECENKVQDVTLGVAPGYKNVGLSAVSDTKELFSAETKLRDSIGKLLSEKLMYRRTRRNGLRYRESRFKNRVKSKKKGWLAPSVEHNLDSHIKLINFIKSILPIKEINVQAAAFDIQKIKNPEISGAEYQNGAQKDFWNIREYVLYRDNHTCHACNGKSKDKILNVHHIESRQTGGDRPDNLITLCEKCHKDYHAGRIELKVEKHKSFKAETIMSILRWKIVDELRNLGNTVNITYGYITKSARIALKLKKSHANDAFCIAGGDKQERTCIFQGKYIRRNNRSLEKFYDAKYIDSRDGKVKTGKKLNLIKSKKVVIENLRIYRKQKISKGRRSIMNQRYKFQPNDLVKFANKIYAVSGMQNLGKYIKLKGIKKPVKTELIQLVKYCKGLQFT